MTCVLAAALAALVFAAIFVALKAGALLDAAASATGAFENAVRTHERVTAGIPRTAAALASGWAAAADRTIEREGRLTRDLVTAALEKLDDRAAAVERDARTQLEAANSAIADVAGIRRDLKPVLERAASLAGRVDDALAPHLDCRSNGNCWPAGVTASLGGFKVLMGEGAQAARRVDTALPRLLDLAGAMAAESGSVAANLNRLTRPRWYDRLLGYGLNAVVMYRNLHPATNLTVKSTEALSGTIAARP